MKLLTVMHASLAIIFAGEIITLSIGSELFRTQLDAINHPREVFRGSFRTQAWVDDAEILRMMKQVDKKNLEPYAREALRPR